MSVPRCQRTVRKPVAVEGFGYFSGRDIRVEFRPAPAGSGVTFVRGDLSPAARVPVSPALRLDVPRRTTLAVARRSRRDGRARAGGARRPGDRQLRSVGERRRNARLRRLGAGVRRSARRGRHASIKSAPVRQIRVKRRIRVGDERNWIEAAPSRGGGLSVAFDLDYSAHPAIGRQTIRLNVHPATFRTELAPCRTFLEEEAARAMVAQGVGQRVTPQNLLIFGPEGPIDNTLRFDNECVRHKVLDVVGDLALTGCEVVADVVAFRSGHRLHAELAQRLMEQAGIAARRC